MHEGIERRGGLPDVDPDSKANKPPTAALFECEAHPCLRRVRAVTLAGPDHALVGAR